MASGQEKWGRSFKAKSHELSLFDNRRATGWCCLGLLVGKHWAGWRWSVVWNYDVLTTFVVHTMSKLRLCHSAAGLASGEVARSRFIRV